jgi:hypothetical protein
MLVAGLAVAVIVIFSRQVLILIDRAREVERAWGLSLIPALLILTIVFLFHQQGKRQEAKAQAAAAEAGAAAAQTRAEEMEASRCSARRSAARSTSKPFATSSRSISQTWPGPTKRGR